jgi:hypothetical protein
VIVWGIFVTARYVRETRLEGGGDNAILEGDVVAGGGGGGGGGGVVGCEFEKRRTDDDEIGDEGNGTTVEVAGADGPVKTPDLVV